MSRSAPCLCLPFALAAVALAAGCGNPEKVAQESSNLKPLVVLYGQFIGQHRGKPPADEAEFKAFVQKVDPERLKSFQVTDVDSMFISSRDNQPYVVRYGKLEGPAGPAGQPVVAYEQTGVDGKRYVASAIGAIEEVDEETFRKMVPDAK
ncbi:MAG: hypothetical protein MUF06_08175 [Pirellulaceae bacterium]|jgi:hypothetical protein|nr:hypothetical protein [Pirellulaceae bacterium]